MYFVFCIVIMFPFVIGPERAGCIIMQIMQKLWKSNYCKLKDLVKTLTVNKKIYKFRGAIAFRSGQRGMDFVQLTGIIYYLKKSRFLNFVVQGKLTLYNVIIVHTNYNTSQNIICLISHTVWNFQILPQHLLQQS